MARFAITTSDNPFDPFTQYDEWFAYDRDKGYNTCAKLARVSTASADMTEQEYDDAVERAIDDIVEVNPLMYMKVTAR